MDERLNRLSERGRVCLISGRNLELFAAVVGGASFVQLAKSEGITPGRIRQIFHNSARLLNPHLYRRGQSRRYRDGELIKAKAPTLEFIRGAKDIFIGGLMI